MIAWLRCTMRRAAWAPLLVFGVFVVMVRLGNLFESHPWVDMPTHFLGGVAITYFFHHAIVCSEAAVGPTPAVIRSVSAVGLTAIAAVVWEFWEYGVDIRLGTHLNHGVSDTLSDLFFGLLGAVLIAALLFRRTGGTERTKRTDRS